MADSLITHSNIAKFADDVVNLHRDAVKAHREQVWRLREKLEGFIREHPDYGLVKMLQSGSVAKGTALSTINDMDVAVYVRTTDVPTIEAELLRWLAERIREAYPTLNRDQINPQSHCVTISFRGSGLDVDVSPVLYEGDSNDCGYLITKESGSRVLTSIPLHLKFIRSRKALQPTHFAQIVRLIKWWARRRKLEDETFRFKSFMIELICAHLADTGLDFSNYPSALEKFFAYIVMSGLNEQIAFIDYYSLSKLPTTDTAPIRIYDPVNPENNVAARYSFSEKEKIIEAAHDALDALNEALYATTKGRAVDLWKIILGPSFRV